MSRYTIVSVLFFVLLLSSGCTGSEPEPKGRPRDSGVHTSSGGWSRDSGVVIDPLDAGAPVDSGVWPDPIDAGFWDSGRVPDAGPPPPPPARCLPGSDGREGCGCEASLSPERFEQDDCRAGLLCVPYDALSGRSDLSGPVQICQRPCTTDRDCGVGRVCVDSGFGASSGLPRVCVDRVADYDGFCGFGRGLVAQVPDASMQTPGEQVGCPASSTCLTGIYSDLNPDEGVCLGLCEADTDCAEPFPYCNPAVFRRTGPDGTSVDVGICAPRRYGQGSICGTTDPDLSGAAFGCDTSAATPAHTRCVPLTGVLPSGQGMCMTTCDANRPCTSREPDGSPQTCAMDFFSSGAGVCASGCTNYPDTCSGAGAEGLGRVCMDYFSSGSGPVGLCVDRTGPPLAAASLDDEGNVRSPGDNCLPLSGVPGFTQCPVGTHCELVDVRQGFGICAAGCGTVGTAASDAQCRQALGIGSAVCTQVFESGGQPVTDIGLCGVP